MQHGDFGLGTLNDLDGEVVVLDGVAYQQRADGSSRVLDFKVKTPFMTMTFLEALTHESTNICDLQPGDNAPLVSTLFTCLSMITLWYSVLL